MKIVERFRCAWCGQEVEETVLEFEVPPPVVKLNLMATRLCLECRKRDCDALARAARR